jgi:hypothetical protein
MVQQINMTTRTDKDTTELRKAWIEKLNNAINLSAGEEMSVTPRSTDMREPVNFAG